jgi:mannosyltransferase OCH1-like enzyme/LmbE family N-acetylglucosaminyl deacetylase
MTATHRYIFISPHLDDAVLSCYPMIRECLDQGVSIQIWTIMAGLPSADAVFSDVALAISRPDPVAYVTLRQQEDHTVGAALGVPMVHLDVLDAIYRSDASEGPLYPTLETLFGRVDFRDLHVVNRIAEALMPLLEPDDVVVAPSAVCGHVDHVLTRLACEMLASEIRYYNEFPYTLQTRAPLPLHIQSEWARMIRLYASQVPLLFPGNTLQHLIAMHQPYWASVQKIQPLIPRILHLIWIGRAPMPPNARRNLELWTSILGSSWTIRLWTNSDLNETHFDAAVLNRIGEAQHGIQKADILRYHILSKVGGWYADLDIEPIQSLEPLALLLWRESLMLCNEEENLEGKISNGFFACSAGHPAITAAAKAVLDQPLQTGAFDMGHIVQHTGPVFFKAMLRDAPAVMLPTRLFYPVTFSEIIADKQVNSNIAFARHIWHNRYRDNTALYFGVNDTPLANVRLNRRSAPDVMIFCFVQHETELLRRWIPYHAKMVGMENIMIIDHGSDEPTKALIRGFACKGLRVYDAGLFSFTEKGRVLSNVMGRFRHCRLLLPMDVDEFICVKTHSGMDCSRKAILKAFKSLPDRPYIYKFGTFDVCNKPGTDYADPLLEMRTFHFFPPETAEVFSTKSPSKSFYPGKYFVATDEGNHGGCIESFEGVYFTNLALAHFHTRGFRHFLAKHVHADATIGVTNLESHIRDEALCYHWIERCMAIKNGEGEAYFDRYICALHGREERALSDALQRLR